jgi:hypothetical protein
VCSISDISRNIGTEIKPEICKNQWKLGGQGKKLGSIIINNGTTPNKRERGKT